MTHTMTFDELLIRIGNDGVVSGVFHRPIEQSQIEGAVTALLESEYSEPAAVQLLRAQLDKARIEVSDAERALTEHIRPRPASTAPRSFLGKIGQALGNLPGIRSLRNSRLFRDKDASPAAAEARDRIRKNLELRREDAARRVQQLLQQLDTELRRAAEDADRHRQTVASRKREWVAALQAEHDSWERRSARLCQNNSREHNYNV